MFIQSKDATHAGIFWPSLRSPQYTLGEKIKTWRGKLSSSASVLRDEIHVCPAKPQETGATSSLACSAD